MATILGIEIGRTEIKIKHAFSLLSKEAVRLIHAEKREWREGFVVLVDVVGWTSKLKLLRSFQLPEFERQINQYLLSFFENEPNVSVISGTGDGYYFTFEEQPSEIVFKRLAVICQRLAQDRPRFKDISMNFDVVGSEQLIVRSSIAYCHYHTGIAESKNSKLKRDHCICLEMPLLQRVMGDEKNPSGPRILSGSVLDSFQGQRPTQVQETKGDLVPYWKFN